MGAGSRGRGPSMRNGGLGIAPRRGVCATASGALAETEETCDDQDSYILAALARPAPIQHPSSQFSQELRPVPAFLDDRSLAARRLRPWRRALGALGSRAGGTRAQAPVRRRHLSLPPARSATPTYAARNSRPRSCRAGVSSVTASASPCFSATISSGTVCGPTIRPQDCAAIAMVRAQVSSSGINRALRR